MRRYHLHVIANIVIYWACSGFVCISDSYNSHNIAFYNINDVFDVARGKKKGSHLSCGEGEAGHLIKMLIMSIFYEMIDSTVLTVEHERSKSGLYSVQFGFVWSVACFQPCSWNGCSVPGSKYPIEITCFRSHKFVCLITFHPRTNKNSTENNNNYKNNNGCSNKKNNNSITEDSQSTEKNQPSSRAAVAKPNASCWRAHLKKLSGLDLFWM